jgi:hypothetical protein
MEGDAGTRRLNPTDVANGSSTLCAHPLPHHIPVAQHRARSEMPEVIGLGQLRSGVHLPGAGRGGGNDRCRAPRQAGGPDRVGW